MVHRYIPTHFEHYIFAEQSGMISIRIKWIRTRITKKRVLQQQRAGRVSEWMR
jgi:hypothetical protein